MLTHLSIRDVVLVDKLDIDFAAGLCVLTGETGAGKSILLGALDLALGGRADAALIRAGADTLTVSAVFAPQRRHPALAMLADQGLASDDDALVLRRVVGRDGRSRAFINDQPVSVGFLRGLGETLVEVHGQFDTHGLLDPASHANRPRCLSPRHHRRRTGPILHPGVERLERGHSRITKGGGNPGEARCAKKTSFATTSPNWIGWHPNRTRNSAWPRTAR